MKTIDDREQEFVGLIQKLVSNSNYMSYNPAKAGKTIANIIRYNHRTLQQVFISTLVNVILEYSKTLDGWVDGRNECAVELCRDITYDLSKSRFFHHEEINLPFI